MRCLYCGKELALLKRWTGGGEFCSDAHRQRYKDEYNQLALTRLLQAKPPAPPDEAGKPQKETAAVETAQVQTGQVQTAQTAQDVSSHRTLVATVPEPEPASSRVPDRTRTKSTQYEPPAPALRETMIAPAPEKLKPEMPKPEETVPAQLAGFFVQMPLAALSEVMALSRPDLQFAETIAAALPHRLDSAEDAYPLDMAGSVDFALSNKPSSGGATAGRERKVEMRDFVRAAPVVEIKLRPAGETGLETASEPMEVVIVPQPPAESAVLWQEEPKGFFGEAELGALARLSFSATGFAGEEHSTEREYPVVIALEPVPIAFEAQPVVEPEAGQPVNAVPERAFTPLPLGTLANRPAAPGKSKPVQIFSSASKAMLPQIPRSTSLPLRPVMTFGPAPAQLKPTQLKKEAKPELNQPAAAPLRPDPRPMTPKAALMEAKPAAGIGRLAAKTDHKPDFKPEFKQDRKPEVREPVKFKEEPRSTPVLPATPAPPHPASQDLGLPRLNMETSSGFLGQIPMLGKIAIVAVLLAALGGLIAFTSKSGGATPSADAGTIVAGSALPAGEAGWITDWGADPGVRRTRQISILRSSQTLTDYRIEMTGQIESKAIGWVFRAQDPKNFYVTKLEIVKPGLEPTVALVRFAIINGEEQAHAQLPLPMKVRLDTMYKIRFDAVGDRFTTYVQDQKVDDWTDGRVRTGGVGFYRERGEDATLKGGMNVVPLIVKK